MARRAAADPPYAPDLPPDDATPLALDAAALREHHGSSIVGARVERADLGGAKLPNLRIVDARLEQCNLANLAARGASLVRCELRGCRLTGSSWVECDLTDARLRRSELRGCELRGLHGVERLRGVGVTWADLLELAPALAGALGIRLLDADDAGAGAP